MLAIPASRWSGGAARRICSGLVTHSSGLERLHHRARTSRGLPLVGLAEDGRSR